MELFLYILISVFRLKRFSSNLSIGCLWRKYFIAPAASIKVAKQLISKVAHDFGSVKHWLITVCDTSNNDINIIFFSFRTQCFGRKIYLLGKKSIIIIKLHTRNRKFDFVKL